MNPFMLLGLVLAAAGLAFVAFLLVGDRRARRAAYEHDAACGNTRQAGPDNAPSAHDLEGEAR